MSKNAWGAGCDQREEVGGRLLPPTNNDKQDNHDHENDDQDSDDHENDNQDYDDHENDNHDNDNQI